jgi:hypothetical protein
MSRPTWNLRSDDTDISPTAWDRDEVSEQLTVFRQPELFKAVDWSIRNLPSASDGLPPLANALVKSRHYLSTGIRSYQYAERT